jgi:hypothetical protein
VIVVVNAVKINFGRLFKGSGLQFIRREMVFSELVVEFELAGFPFGANKAFFRSKFFQVFQVMRTLVTGAFESGKITVLFPLVES